MKINKVICLLTGLLLLMGTACNSDDNSTFIIGDYETGYSVMVTSFSLMKNDSIIENLDSVYFSIDLNNGRIFNADSLPVGTKINKLQVNIELPTCRVASLREFGALPSDTIDYLKASTDTVDFSKGPVTLHLVSANGEVECNYRIEVNVHKTNPNYLAWVQTAQGELPTNLNQVVAQGTVEKEGKLICFTTDGTSYCRAESSDPYAGLWSMAEATLPTEAVLESMVNVSGEFYVLDSNGELYKSSDEGASWTSTGATMSHIYGACDGKVLGVKNTGSGYVHCTYPAGEEKAVASGCPVSGTSQVITYVSEWTPNPLTIFCGGVTASGEVTGATWAFDGEEWAEISNTPIPEITGMTLVPYFSFKVNNQWQVTEQSILLAFGGMKADGEMNTKSYLSYNRGVDWKEAGTYLDLSSDIMPACGRQAFVVKQTLGSRASGAWNMLPARRLPHWLSYSTGSRAVGPIDEWDCPFIYLFGGNDMGGNIDKNIWRGAINRMTFKPLQ